MASPRRSGARRRTASPRRGGTRQQSRPLPAAGPGERVWVLDVPYGTQVDGATWHPAVKTHLHVGRVLPEHLAPYAPGPHT
ncbi:MAG: helicase, partial [Rhodococcus sp. (in: high G+C Gram-positive bacteria)]